MLRKITLHVATAMIASLAVACVGGNGTTAVPGGAPKVANTVPLTVDAGPAGTGAINHAYVTVKVCTPASTTHCASIDHVLVDTASWGLRLVNSVLAMTTVSLSPETDANGHNIEECATFGGGQTWGPVALADVTLAGESAANVPVQIMDDSLSFAPPPSSCGANGTLINSVSGFDANGVLGIGVFAQDCGVMCTNSATPLAIYYGCTSGSGGSCAAENVALSQQVTNPVWMFSADNNGTIIDLPNLQNANGDPSVQGSLIIGLNTQTDNMLPPVGLTVLGTNSSGDFTANYNGSNTALPSWIDSGADAFDFDDATIGVCNGPAFVGYYCPATAPLPRSAVNTGIGVNSASSTVQFAVADPNTFVQGASAFANLAGGGGSSTFVWGMPYFYGKKIYVGIEQRTAGIYTGPYFAY
jgi:hypothetical protein